MNLTQLVRSLESQLKNAEKLARQYDGQATALKNKLVNVANIVGAGINAVKIAASSGKSRGGSSGLSAAGRAKIIAAQRKRWAKFKSRSGSKTKAPKAKAGKSKLSAAGRAKIIAAQRKRWASFRKAGK